MRGKRGRENNILFYPMEAIVLYRPELAFHNHPQPPYLGIELKTQWIMGSATPMLGSATPMLSLRYPEHGPYLYEERDEIGLCHIPEIIARKNKAKSSFPNYSCNALLRDR